MDTTELRKELRFVLNSMDSPLNRVSACLQLDSSVLQEVFFVGISVEWPFLLKCE